MSRVPLRAAATHPRVLHCHDYAAIICIHTADTGSIYDNDFLEIYSGGGIVGILWTGSRCENCAYFGDITSLTPTKPGETYGSVAGSTAAGTKITGCKFGGSVLGSTISESNCSSFVAGDGNAAVSSCVYWNGK